VKWLQTFFDFYINASIHVAIAVLSLTWVTLFQLDVPFNYNILCFVFFATIVAYNFVKYFGLAKFHHRSLANWLRVIQVFSALCFVVMCYFAFTLYTHVLLAVIVLGAITFLYAVPLLPKHYLFDEQRNLRQISGLKIYVIALVWTCATVVLPLLHHNVLFNADVFLTLVQRFIMVLVLMLPFEIRDLNYDSLKLATIPQQIGVKRTKRIGVLLLLLFVLLEFFKDELTSAMLLSTVFVAFLIMMFLLFSKKRQSKYYCSFWVESLPIWWLFLLILLS